MNRGDLAVLAVIQILAIRWLKIQRWVLPATMACVGFYWLWAVAVYVDAGEWPNVDGVMLIITLSAPLLLVPCASVVFRQAATSPDSEWGMLAFMFMTTIVPLALLILALDAWIILFTGRNFVMSGQFLPAL
jgi:hypothetical protein